MGFLRTSITALVAGALMAFATQSQAAPADEETLDITFIIHCCLGNVFWEPMIHGVKEAADLFNLNVDIQNADNDPERNKNLIETAIANGVDGIVAMISVEDALTAAVQKARDAGIAVMSSNIDDPDGDGPDGTARQAYVGQDFAQSGYLIGKRMVDEHGLGEGDFCVVAAEFPDLVYAQGRYAGISAGLETGGVAHEMIGTGGVVDENQNIIAQYLLANPDTDCVIGAGNVPTSVAPQSAEEAGLEGLPNGGFDVNPRVMENINAGLTTGTMDQQPFWQGFLPVMYIAYNVRYGLAPVESDTGKALVDLSNAKQASDNAGTYR